MIKLPRIRLPLIRFSRRVVYFMVAAALLFGAGSGAIFAAIPVQDEREATRITYNLKGQLSHQAYGYVLPEKPPPNPIYFTRLVDSITASYRYELVTEKPVTELTELVEIRAMVGSPGLWEKEVVLVPPTQKEGDFTVTFPLDRGALFQLAKDIAVELGAGVPAPEVTLKALVYTVAQTEKGPLREELVQTAKVKMGSATLELVRPLARQKRGDLQGLRYEQRGAFGYDIAMKPTTLYNDLSLEEMKRRPSSPPSSREAPAQSHLFHQDPRLYHRHV